MLLKSLILRKGGSIVTFGPHLTPDEVAYQFTGPEAGPHVCDVADEVHAARLLALEPGAFAPADDAAEISSGPAAPATPPASDAEPIEEEESEEEAEREARREAAAEYREVVGKNPGPKWTTEQIIEKTLAFLDGKEED